MTKKETKKTKKSKEESVEEKTTITLEKMDCALIFNQEGIELCLPKMEDDEDVPEYFLFFMALTALLEQQNQKLYDIIDTEIESILEQVERDREQGNE